MTNVKDLIIDYKESVELVNKMYVKGELSKEKKEEKLIELFEEVMERIDNLFKKLLGE